nr:hypothetical protein Iba_scaffold1393CG0730 [Ipomoea batatas]
MLLLPRWKMLILLNFMFSAVIYHKLPEDENRGFNQVGLHAEPLRNARRSETVYDCKGETPLPTRPCRHHTCRGPRRTHHRRRTLLAAVFCRMVKGAPSNHTAALHRPASPRCPASSTTAGIVREESEKAATTARRRNELEKVTPQLYSRQRLLVSLPIFATRRRGREMVLLLSLTLLCPPLPRNLIARLFHWGFPLSSPLFIFVCEGFLGRHFRKENN